MDILDETLLSLWKAFEKFQLKYILVGGFATILQGFINHLIEDKIASNWLKDKIDVEELKKIRDQRYLDNS